MMHECLRRCLLLVYTIMERGLKAETAEGAESAQRVVKVHMALENYVTAIPEDRI